MEKISQNTSVQIGLVVLVLSVFLGSVVSAVWWASAMNTKLDSLIKTFATLSEVDRSNSVRIDQLERLINKFELVGSPKVSELEKRIAVLEKKP